MATNDVYLRPDAGDGTNGVRLRPDAPDPSKINYVLACDAGAYSYVGNDATLKVGRFLALDAGAYAYAGNDATLKVGRLLALDGGAYAYVGNDATLTYVPGAVNYTLACAAGAYTYTGNDATLTYVPGVVNYDTHDGVDTRKRDKRIREEKQKLREMLNEAFDAVQGITLPEEVEQNKQVVEPLVAKITPQDVEEVKAQVRLLVSQMYMQAAIQKAAQDEDDVETLMLLNG